MNAGAVHIFLASDLGATPLIDIQNANYIFVGNSETHTGDTASSVTDIDGDGRSDILVGAPYPMSASYRGKVYLIFSSTL
jgi:hypothetical protein